MNQRGHSFLGGKGLGIQQGTSVCVGSSKSMCQYVESRLILMPLVELLVHGYVTLLRKAKCEVDM